MNIPVSTSQICYILLICLKFKKTKSIRILKDLCSSVQFLFSLEAIILLNDRKIIFFKFKIFFPLHRKQKTLVVHRMAVGGDFSTFCSGTHPVLCMFLYIALCTLSCKCCINTLLTSSLPASLPSRK